MSRFLRTVRTKKKVRKANFECRPDEPRLSWYLEAGCLTTPDGLRHFQEYNCAQEGFLPAVYAVDPKVLQGLALSISPASGETGDPFGDLHHESNCPNSSAAETLACNAIRVAPYASSGTW